MTAPSSLPASGAHRSASGATAERVAPADSFCEVALETPDERAHRGRISFGANSKDHGVTVTHSAATRPPGGAESPGGDVLAAARIDRLVRHAEIIEQIP